MKARHLFLPASLVIGLTTPSALRAADQTWIDANANNNWNSTDANWDAGVVWTSGNSAIFGGTGETVSLTETTSADTLTFNVGGYTISGSTLTLSGSQTVNVVNSSDSAIFTAALSGGTLNKTGAGTMVLNAANSLSTVNVNAGKLEITGQYTNNRLSNGAVVNVASGAIVDIKTENPIPTGSLAAATSFVLNGGTLTSTGGSHTHIGNVTLNAGTWTTGAGASTYDGERWKFYGDVTVGGSAASTISGNGIGLVGARTFTVNDVTGDANVDLTVSADLNNGENSTGSLIKAGTGRMNLGTSSYTGSTTVDGGHLAVTGTLRTTSSMTVNAGATLELGATNMFVGGHGTALADSRVLTANGGTLLMNGSMESRIGNIVLSNGGTFTSNRSLSSWDVLLGNTVGGAATITVANSGGNTSAATMNGSGGIHLGGVQNFDVADVTGSSAADLNVSMILDNGGSQGGDGGVNKLGAGTMAISTRATYTGGTTIQAGVLNLTGGGGSAGTIRGTATVNTGGTLRLSTGDATGYATDSTRLSVINLTGGMLDVNSTSNQTLGSAVINMTGGSITGISNSNLDFFGGASALNTLESATTSVISGVALSPLRQGSTTFTVADGAAAVDLRIDSVLRNSPSGNAGGSVLIKAGAGTMQLTANNTLTNGLTINGGVVDVSANGLYRNSDGTAAYNNSAVVTINTGGTLRLKSYSYNGDGGLGGLRDYAGNRVINGGTLEVVGASHSSGSDFTIGTNGGTFRYNPANASDTLTLTGNVNTNTQVNGALTFETLGNITVEDTMEGTGSLSKTGAGTLALNATNTYAGSTTVTQGKLLINGATSTLSQVSVAANGTLGGYGTVGGDTTILGTLAPGNSAGTLSFSNDLGLGAGSDWLVEIGGTDLTDFDRVLVSGQLSAGGTIGVSFLNGFNPTLGNSFQIASFGSFVDDGYSFNFTSAPLDSGLAWDTSSFATNGTITVIPEPKAALLGAIGILLLFRRRK